MKEIIITKNEEGYKVKRLCQKYLPAAPTSFIYKMLRKKNIVLNDKKSTGDEVVKVGDSIKLYLSDETIDKFKTDNPTKRSEKTEKTSEKKYELLSKDVIYEDEDILIAYKPIGILSQKSRPEDYSINEAIIDYLLSKGKIDSASLELFKPSVCNRLDRNTSGLVLASKSPHGARYLSDVLRDRSVKKYYLAVCMADCRLSGTYKAYLSKDEASNKVTVYDKELPGSKPIETAVELMDYNDDLDVSLLRIELITGKSHQIRAHLAHLGYPLIGDIKYGKPFINGIFNKKFGIRSQMLLAYSVTFPDGDEKVSGRTFSMKLPASFRKMFPDINI